jgi:hypothetical protein
MFHLSFPNISHKSEYLAMIEEWKSFETTLTSPSILFRWETFEEFLSIVERNRVANTLWVPATCYFFMDDDGILWAIQIRPPESITWWLMWMKHWLLTPPGCTWSVTRNQDALTRTHRSLKTRHTKSPHISIWGQYCILENYRVLWWRVYQDYKRWRKKSESVLD